jgi:hypothetical protein
MQRERQAGPKRSRGRQRSAEGRSSAASALAELEGRFARFRRAQPRGARVPEELRAAVLAAVGQGVRPGELQRSCGVTWSQVAIWQSMRAVEQRRAGSAGPTEVRVFSVVDEPREEHPEPPELMGERGLELRLGPWTVSVWLAGPGPHGRS